MDHNNKHILPGFHSAFPTAFAGLQNAGTSAFMSTLSHFSGLSAPILPTGGLGSAELAQWAASQPTQQSWIDTAKVAAMLPGLYFTGVKGLDLTQQSELLSQQGISVSGSSLNGSSSAANLLSQAEKKTSDSSSPSPSRHVVTSSEPLDSPAGDICSLSSSHPSASTPNEVDVAGGSSQPSSSQATPYDLSVRGSPFVDPTSDVSFDGTRPSTSFLSGRSARMLDPASPKKSVSRTSKSSQPEDTWDDLVDVDLLSGLFDGATPSTSSSKTKTGPDPVRTSTSFAGPTASSSSKKCGNTVGSGAADIFEADKEFDYILNMVTERNDKVAASTFPFDFPGMDGSSGLSPVQFTPPDSPTGGGTTDSMDSLCFFGSADNVASTSTATPLAATPSAPSPVSAGVTRRNFDPFKQPCSAQPAAPRKREPFVPRPVQKFNKVPVYKQKRGLTVPKEEEVSESRGESNDAYSFEEEEDHALSRMDPRERLDAEVREKLSRISAGQCPENRNKNVYVPGVGFAVPQEQPQQDLWRHVVPKKRPIESNRPIIPAANLLPSSVHAEACQAAARLAEPEIVTLAESIRRRKKDRFVCEFIKTEQTMSKDCATEDITHKKQGVSNDCDGLPRLPKLVIRLPKRSSDIYGDRKKKKKKSKKRKHEEDDSDWEGSNRLERRRNKKEARQDSRPSTSGYEIRFVDPEPEFKSHIEEDKTDVSMFSKKKRLMIQWQEGQENCSKRNGDVSCNGATVTRVSHSKRRNEFNTEAIKLRLSKFGPADGHLPKGTFVVAKSDLFRDDCALWRVDNQNLLQKYPPRVDPTTKTISYKNSSTYSGWCDQIASGYYRVAVRYVKQTRSEAVIQPEIALSDLFPAMTTECLDTNGFITVEEEMSVDPNDHMVMLRDPLRLSLYTLTQVLVDHALTLDHLQSMKQKNDWSFLQAVTEIDRINSDCLNKLRSQCKFRDDFEISLNTYTKINMTDADVSGVVCQACLTEKNKVEKIVQLLGLDVYDRDTLQPVARTEEENETTLPAMEYWVCSICASSAQQYHSCYHMKYHLLKKCEDKLEILGTHYPDYSPERIVDMAKKGRVWQSKVFAEFMDVWRKIQNSSVVSSNS